MLQDATLDSYQKPNFGSHQFLPMLLPAMIAITIFLPLWAWTQTVDNPFVYFSHSLPPGQAQYVLSKLLGLYAICFVWLQMMTALLAGITENRDKKHPYFKYQRRLHAGFGMACILTSVAHAGLFIAAVSIRNGHFASALLLPNFSSGYYSMSVSLGVIGLWGLTLVALAGVIRRRAPKFWRWLHRLSVVCFVLFFLHGLFIGTESRQGFMLYFYTGLIASLTFAFIARVTKGWLQDKCLLGSS